MLKRFLAFVVLAALVLGVGLLFQWNPAVVEFRWSPTRSVSLPLPLLVLGSAFVGAVAIFVLALVRETQWTLLERRRARREARRARAHSLVATGGSWFWHGRPDRAKRAIVRAPAVERGVEPSLWLAQTALEDDKPDDARFVIEDGLAVHPEDPRLLAMLADVHAAENDAPRATALLERAASLAPESPRIAAALRDSYAREHRWRDALAAEDRYLALARSSVETAREQKRLLGLRYEIALEHESPEESIRALYPLARGATPFLPAALSLGDLLASEGRPLEALRVWLRAATSRPEPVLLDRIERVCRESERGSRMVAFYEQLRRRADSPLFVRRLVRFLLTTGNVTAAAAVFDAAPHHFPDDRELVWLRAEVERRRENVARALGAIEEAFASGAPEPAYVCRSCERHATRWSPRCPSCGRWDELESVDPPPRLSASRWQELVRRFAGG
jgi:HemY protein